MTAHRVSNLEQFRQYESDPDFELSDLLERLQWNSVSSPAMLAGTAFHKALELADSGVADTLEANGYTFTFRGDFDLELSPIRELRAFKTYHVDGQPFIVTGQVDEIHGRTVIDHKTTGRFDPDRYLDGFQWRLYLDIFGADLFRWNVFEMKPGDEPMQYEITAAHRLEQYRYPALADDCQSLVERYARFYQRFVAPGSGQTEAAA